MLTPVGGAALDAAGNDFNARRFSNGLAKTAGLATTMVAGAKWPAVIDAATRPGLGGDIAAGAKGAASGAFDAAKTPVKYGRLNLQIPQPIAGAVAGGYAARELGLPHEVGAVVGGAAPLVRGAISGAKEALAARAAAQTAALSSSAEAPAAAMPPRALLGPGPIVTPPPADASGPIAPVLPENYRPPVAAIAAPGATEAAAPAPPAVTPEILNQIAAQMGYKKGFAAVPADGQQIIRNLAEAATKTPPKPRAAASRCGLAQAAPPPAAVVPPASAPLVNGRASIAEQLREAMAPGVKPGEGGVATIAPEPAPSELPDPKALKQAMRDLPPGTPNKIADANYAANQEPKQDGMVYEAAGRATKAQNLSQMLYDEGMTARKVAKWDGKAWEAAAKDRGMPLFSTESQGEVIDALKKLEKKVK